MQFSDYKKMLQCNFTRVNHLANNGCLHLSLRVRHSTCDHIDKLFALLLGVGWRSAHLGTYLP